MTTRTRSPVSGLVLLVVGAAVVLVGRAVLAPDIAGVGAAAPWASPPPVGSCVVVETDQTTVVPCDQPHTSEVAATWSAGVIPAPPEVSPRKLLTVSVEHQLTVSAVDEVCRGWAEQYVGWPAYVDAHRDQLWLPPEPLVSGRLVKAPASQGTSAWHWSACVVETLQPQFRGTVRQAASRVVGHPDQLSVCLAPGEHSVDFVDCRRPHTVELLATAILTNEMMLADDISVGRTAADVVDLCEQLARTRTGSSDPTFGGQLAVVTESVWAQAGPLPQIHPPGWVIPDCIAKVTGSRPLIGSVVGVGDGELPLAG